MISKLRSPRSSKKRAAGARDTEASSHHEATSNVQSDILEQLLPTLAAMEQRQQQTLYFYEFASETS